LKFSDWQLLPGPRVEKVLYRLSAVHNSLIRPGYE